MIYCMSNEQQKIMDFQKKIESLNTVKQLTFLERKELVFKENNTLKRPSYHL